MEKRISYQEFLAAKRTAQICSPLFLKRENIKKKIDALQEEFNVYDAQIKAFEEGITNLTGLRVEQLIQKVVEPAVNPDGSPKLTKEGKQAKTTKYVPSSLVQQDKENKQFIISLPDEEPKPAEPSDVEPASEWA